MSRLGAVEVGMQANQLSQTVAMCRKFARRGDIRGAKQAHYHRFADGRVKFVLKCFDEPRHEIRAYHLGIRELLGDRLRIMRQIAV